MKSKLSALEIFFMAGTLALGNAYAGGADYQATNKVTGELHSIGSDTLEPMMKMWTEELGKLQSGLKFVLVAKGSGAAPPALVSGESQLGPMSRKMEDKEVDSFLAKYGYKPTAVRVAVDALAVFVNKANTVAGLTLEQVDQMFSANRACGGKEDITKWGQLGLTGDLGGKELVLYGRDKVSGTFDFFKKKALCKGDFKATINEQAGSEQIVDEIGKADNAVGYSGIGYAKPTVRALPIADKAGKPFLEANAENASSGNYPLARFLYIYVNKPADKPLDANVKEFLTFVLSKQGQDIVAKDNYIPLPDKVIEKELEAIK